jgi:hypothetical protein
LDFDTFTIVPIPPVSSSFVAAIAGPGGNETQSLSSDVALVVVLHRCRPATVAAFKADPTRCRHGAKSLVSPNFMERSGDVDSTSDVPATTLRAGLSLVAPGSFLVDDKPVTIHLELKSSRIALRFSGGCNGGLEPATTVNEAADLSLVTLGMLITDDEVILLRLL